MAYKVDPPNTDPPDSTAGGPVTMTDIENFFSGNESPEFYELETAEVKEIYLDEEDLPLNKDGDPDWSRYGWAMVRLSVSAKSLTDVIEARPLDSNIKQYPLPGEFVIVAENYFKEYYYIQKINSNSSVNFNFLPGFSTHHVGSNIGTNPNIKDFKPDGRIRQLQAEEGDITFNGRFGQSIRFGSNITTYGKLVGEEIEALPDTGKIESPNVIIRAGQGDPANLEGENIYPWNLDDFPNRPIREDINNDGSSIWITTDQTVPLKEVVYSKLRNRNAPKLDGNQIILNSDRVVFNAKKSHIFMSAAESIDISANHMITLQLNDENVSGGLTPKSDSGKLKLGDMDADQPVLGGNQTMELVNRLSQILEEFAKNLIPAVGITTAPGAPVPISQINIAAAGMYASLAKWRTRLDEPKSRSVSVAHIIGPKVPGEKG